MSNTGQTAGSDLATATGRVSYAQSFTTGVHPDGYFLSSVDVGLKADSGVTAEVALWWSHRGVFGRTHWLSLLPDSHIDDAFGSGQHRRRRRDTGAVQRERCAALTRYDLLDRGDQDRGRR